MIAFDNEPVGRRTGKKKDKQITNPQMTLENAYYMSTCRYTRFVIITVNYFACVSGSDFRKLLFGQRVLIIRVPIDIKIRRI